MSELALDTSLYQGQWQSLETTSRPRTARCKPSTIGWAFAMIKALEFGLQGSGLGQQQGKGPNPAPARALSRSPPGGPREPGAGGAPWEDCKVAF
jgi:hypothetical protein